LRRRARGAGDAFRFLEDALLQLAPRLLVARLREHAVGKIGLELAQLVAQYRDVRGLGRDPAGCGPCEQRHQYPSQRRRHHRDGDEYECDHERSFLVSPASSLAARSRSSAVSGGASPWLRRLRRMRASAAKPRASSSAGPAQSSQVVGLSGGW
jgi:hypothetical protein